jgi:hypothetical protein
MRPRLVAVCVLSVLALGLPSSVAHAFTPGDYYYPNANPHSAAAKKYLAPTRACPIVPQTATTAAQERSLRCMIAWARKRQGLTPLSSGHKLSVFADESIAGSIRCGPDYSRQLICGHTATMLANRARIPQSIQSSFLTNYIVFATDGLGVSSPRTIMLYLLNNPWLLYHLRNAAVHDSFIRLVKLHDWRYLPQAKYAEMWCITFD